MKFAGVAAISAFAVGVLSSSFEPHDFDVKAALKQLGFDISLHPRLENLDEHAWDSNCLANCDALQTAFGGGSVLFQYSKEYDAFTDAYYSAQQGALNPQCVFAPVSATQVSTAVLLSRLTKCPFAVKGGGHTPFAGASSIKAGITITLEKMDKVTLSPDKKIAAVESGNRWLRVYEVLEKEGLAVIGGRMPTIGVSGLTLGGGISHFSNAHGWACDNVESFEVVTASGALISVSATSFPDLYWALRGGGNNFGIVTKFYMRTFPQGGMWGGSYVTLESEFDAIYAAYFRIASNATWDTKHAQILSFAIQNRTKAVSINMQYSEPTPWPSIFEDYKAIPRLQDTTSTYNLTTATRIMGAGSPPDGGQATFWDRTFKLDKDLMKLHVDTFYSMLPSILDAAGLLPVLTFQAITVPAMEKMQQNDGNVFGLDPTNGPLYIANLALLWTDPSDNDRMMSFGNELYKQLQKEAMDRGLTNDFIYMNYASPYQDVFASYGANKQRLKQIAARYDPTAVFLKLQPGHFKLEGAPYGSFPA